MRALHLSVLTAGLLGMPLLAAPAAAAPAPPLLYSVPDRELEEQVSLQLRDVPLREALQVLFRGTKVECRVGADIPDVPLTFTFPNVRRETALQGMVRLASATVLDLSLSTEGGSVVLRREQSKARTALVSGTRQDDPSPTPRLLIRRYGGGDQLRVDTDIREMPLRQALDALFRHTGETYSIDKNVPDVSVWLRVDNTAFSNAVRWTVRMAATQLRGVVVDHDDRGYHVLVTDHPEQRPELRLTTGLLHDPGLVARRVSLDLQRTPLREAFRQVFQNSGFALQVEPDVPDVKITLRLDQIPVSEAVQRLRQECVREIPDLVISTRDDVINLKRADAERARLLRQLHP